MKEGNMKAFALQGFDQEPRLVDIALPEPGEGEVRVRVHAASVNGFDLAVANGMLKGAMEHNFPVVLGKDFAGVIDAVGPGVDGFTPGERVFGVVMKPTLGDGSIAQYVTVSAAFGIAKLPDGIDFTNAAGLALAGATALDSFDAAHITEGMAVVVSGATGGVGQQGVQLAVRAGAKVIATASSEHEIELVKQLGATHTIDYTQDLAPQITAIAPQGIDVVLHFAGSPQPLASTVKPGGAFVSTVLMSAKDVDVEDVTVTPIMASPTAATLGRVAENHVTSHTTLTIQNVYEIDQASDAFAAFAAGTRGKLVIAVD